MQTYRKRNRSDQAVNPEKMPAAMNESELVLKLKKDELFDQYVLLPHSELNSIVFDCVDSFVEKYKGTDMTLTIFTGPLSTLMQDVFRETYRSHYEDEYQKVQRYLKRHYYLVVTLLVLSIFTFFIFSQLASLKPDETLVTYIIGNISCFCLWEVGYTQFATRDVIDEKKRILRARDAVIGFQCHEDHEK